jgi:predicted amidophosphoribosyltransferase
MTSPHPDQTAAPFACYQCGAPVTSAQEFCADCTEEAAHA